MQMIRFRNRWSTLIAILLTLTALSCADYPEGAEEPNQPIVPDLTFDAAEDTVLTLAADAGVLTQIDGADPATWAVASTGTLATTGPQDCEDCEKGSVEMSSDGSFSYTPADDFEGNDYLYINVASDTGGEGEYIILFEVAGSNDPPRAEDDSTATDEDTAVTITPLENDAEVDLDDSFALVSVDDPEHGTATADVETGEVAYTPAANYFGEDRFSYVIADAAGAEATATISVTVNPVNDPPTAVADEYNAGEDQPLTVSAAEGVLGNDSDIDDDADGISVSAGTLSTTQGGSVEMAADGGFTYAPAGNFQGDDSFTYDVVDDAGASAQGTVTLTVAAVNDNPTTVNDSYSAREDTTLNITAAEGVLINDSDIDGDTLTVIPGTLTTTAGGSAVITADGGFSYSPASNFDDSDSFTYNVSDGRGGIASATVTLNVASVEDPPVAVDDLNIAVLEETPTLIDVLANDSDPDGDTLTIAATGNPEHGSVAFSANNTLTYTPDEDYDGEDSFVYTISDESGREDSATVTVLVGNVNDPPVAEDDEYSAEEDTLLTINSTTGLLANDSDVDGNTLTVNDGTFDTDQGGTVVLFANGRFRYTPAIDFVGIDTFDYTVSDGEIEVVATVTVTVSNIAPVANRNEFDPIGSRDTVSLNVLDDDTNGGAASNLGELIRVTSVRYKDVDYLPGNSIRVGNDNATLTFSSDGTMTIVAEDFGLLILSESLEYTIDDFEQSPEDPLSDSAEVAWSFFSFGGAVSLATPPTHNTDEDDGFSIGVAEGVLSEAGIEWSVSTTTTVATRFGGRAAVNADGSFDYTPAPHFNGADSFAFTATDNGAPETTADGQIVVTVAPVNDGPLARDDGYAVGVGTTLNVSAAEGLLHNDIDLEGDGLTISSVADGGLTGVLNWQADGAFTYAAPGVVGTESFSYTVSDGSASRTAGVTLVVGPGSLPFAVADSYSTTEDTPLTVGGSGVRANDSGGTSVSASGSSNFGGSVSMNAGGSFSYTPPPNFNGTDSFAYTLTDGGRNVDGLVRINVSAAPDAPLAGDDFFQTGSDTPISIAATTGVLANDNDADGDSLTVTTTGSITTDEGGSAEIAANGSFTYIPPTGFTGTDRFDYTMNDGTGSGAAATVIVTVVP